jgi:hypothetical protein
MRSAATALSDTYSRLNALCQDGLLTGADLRHSLPAHCMFCTSITCASPSRATGACIFSIVGCMHIAAQSLAPLKSMEGRLSFEASVGDERSRERAAGFTLFAQLQHGEPLFTLMDTVCGFSMSMTDAASGPVLIGITRSPHLLLLHWQAFVRTRGRQLLLTSTQKTIVQARICAHFSVRPLA